MCMVSCLLRNKTLIIISSTRDTYDRLAILLDRLVEVLSNLPSRNWVQLESLLTLLRRIAMEPTGGMGLHGPSLAALGAVLGPLLARPEGSAHMSIRHAKVYISQGHVMSYHPPLASSHMYVCLYVSMYVHHLVARSMTQDLPKLAALGSSMIQHAPDLLIPKGKKGGKEKGIEG